MASKITKIMFQVDGKRTTHDDGPEFLGRNGYGVCTGIEVWALEHAPTRIRLTPISTKGLASGHLEIQRDVLPVLIAHLTALLPKDEIDGAQGANHAAA